MMLFFTQKGCRALGTAFEDETYKQVELPVWQELTPWQRASEDVIDRHGGPDAVPKMSIKKAKRVRKAIENFAPKDYPPQPLYPPFASAYGDTLTRELFEEPDLCSAPAGLHSDSLSQKEQFKCEARDVVRKNPLLTREAPINPLPYNNQPHIDEGELEGLYDHVYDDITLDPFRSHVKSFKPRFGLSPESVVGGIGTKRDHDDDLPLSPRVKRRRTMADRDMIDGSLVEQSQDSESLDTPRPASPSRTAAEIGREVRKNNLSSLRRRKLQRYTANEKLDIHGGVSQISKEEVRTLMASCSDDSESRDSSDSRDSDSENESFMIDSPPTTPDEAPEDKEVADVSQAQPTQEHSPASGSSHIMDSGQEPFDLETTARIVDGSFPDNLSHVDAEKQDFQISESLAGLKEFLDTPCLMQIVVKKSQHPEHEMKDIPAVHEDTETLETPTTPSKKKQKILKSPCQGRKNQKKPLKPTSPKIEKPARVTRSKAKANVITKFEKLNNAGKLPVDWTT